MKAIMGCFLIVFLTQCSNQNSNTIQSSDGVEIHYKQKGQGNPTIVFIHGWSSNSECWKDQFEYFSDKYNVIILDLPGFGRSGKNRTQWTIDNYGDDIKSTITKLKLENVILVGHSMGGLVALSAATKIPDKTKGIVLVDILNDINNQMTDIQIEDLISSWKVKIRKDNLEGLNTFYFKTEHAQRHSDILPNEIPDFWWDLLREAFHWMNDEAKSTLQKIKKPILSINSELIKTDSLAMRQYTLNFHVQIISETSHYLFWDKPKEFNEVLFKAIESELQ